ncbi:phosphonate metabolism transcriptional regulator PhnF [Roseovarius pacificus]|uniref:phosphonate metabolism transcriptional regulator PhnF n=1 Tax=Roseovarius pacificus TaxID=337701 RepID=UPI002A18B1CA|nr:phosphonate metabolism transcriptional regulator PhnF [Roseovarius pacificus]
MPPAQQTYRQIRDTLRREICSGKYGESRLPGEQTIAARFDVNRHTVRRAIDDLMAEGLVMREQGRPPRVLPPRVRYVIDPARGATVCFNEQGVSLITQFRGIVEEKADTQAAEALRIALDAPLIRLEVLRFAKEHPIALSTLFFPHEPGAKVLADYTGGAVHVHLKQKHGLMLSRESTSIYACLPEENDARLLEISPRSAVLVSETINLDASSGIPVQFTITRMRGDSFQVVVSS